MVKEAAEALSVPEDFYEQILHGVCATEQLAAISAIVAAQNRTQKQANIRNVFVKWKYVMLGKISRFCSFDISTIG